MGATLLGLVLASLVSLGSGRADDASVPNEAASLRTRLSQLEARQDAAYARGALDQAAGALRTAADPATEPGAAARAQNIARAALVLAGRQLDLHQSDTKLVAAQRRLDAIRDRAAAQRRVLEALLKERASLVRVEEHP